MNIILAGPAGSGKGTQAKFLAKKLKLPHISIGLLLRDNRNKGDKISEAIIKAQDTGVLVTHDITFKILKERLTQADCKKGFILDGFPRDDEQGQFLKNNFKIDYAIKLNIDNDLIIKRLSSRRECKKCSQIFGIDFQPKKQGICDKCGGELYHREDDQPAAIKKRLSIYRNDTEPVFEKYFKEVLHEVNGAQKPDKVLKDILKALNR